jgi:radical SAM superfamily enzyme YgiQ (UPF0313 family)
VHVTLVKPTLGRTAHDERFVDEARMEPLSLGLLAGLTPDGVDLTLFDDRVDAFDPDTPTDLVAITVETFTARRAYEIAAAYRERGVPVVIGGMHATLLPEEVAEHADAVVTGDAETVWAQLVRDAHDGRLDPRYHGTCGVPQPGARARRDLYRGKGYLPVALVQFGRGCRHHCAFCAVGAYFAHRHHARPVAEVISEIEASGRRDLFFVDDNLVADPDAAKELLRALAPLGVRWVSQASLDHTRDPEMLRLFAESGCLGNVIGFESLDPDNLRDVRKGPNLRASPAYADEVGALRAHHLQTWAAFILGFDHDTVASLEATCSWATQQRFAFAAFNVLMPYPGTALYARLAEEGRLLYDGRWWLHPDYRFNHAAFRPARMTADELTEVGWRCRQRWSSPGSIVRRALDPATHLHSIERFAVYCAYNPLFRRASFRKQDMRLGTR